MKPKKISVRSANESETGVLIVWVYHRKARIQLAFDEFTNVETCIREAVNAWEYAMKVLED